MSGWQLAQLSLLYLLLLCLLSLWGAKKQWRPRRSRALVYALSLAVYFSAWSYLGSLDQALSGDISFLGLYIGPALLLSLGWPVLERLIRIGRVHRITSVADFLAARFGRSRSLAVSATLISVVAGIPYLSLQFKAIAIAGDHMLLNPPLLDPAISATLALGVFAILLGTRSLQVSEQQPGLVLAIAAESVIKLLTFLALGGLMVWALLSLELPATMRAQPVDFNAESMISLLVFCVITAAAFLGLPRQFHVMVVECPDIETAARSRWLFMVYLLLMLVPVLAIAWALGTGDQAQVIPGSMLALVDPLSLPLVAWLGWLGLLSAASSMALVAAITLSTMISNEFLFPYLVRSGRLEQQQFAVFSRRLLRSRRYIIAGLMLMAYLVYRLSSETSLFQLGMLSLGGVAQLTPALVYGIYSRHTQRHGVYAGMLAGMAIWLFGIACPLLGFWPSEVTESSFALGLRILTALLVNLSLVFAISQLWRPGAAERLHAARFLGRATAEGEENEWGGRIRRDDLQALARRFVGPNRTQSSFAEYYATTSSAQHEGRFAEPELIEHTENLLGSVLGSTSARLVLRKAIDGGDIDLEEAGTILGEASRQLQLSKGRLQAAIEHAAEGICVVDENLNLLAWNRCYQELFNYPEELLKVGQPGADLIRFNAARGWCGPGDVEVHVAKRIKHMRRGIPHTSERLRPDGRFVKVVGNPVPGGGFVMTFQDITEYRRVEQALKESNDSLEARVTERTRALSEVNTQLAEAKALAEQANASKSRYLAACGHDLMQPLNAARLFTSALLQQQLPQEQQAMVHHIRGSLQAAGDLLNDLLDISRLDGGVLKVRSSVFSLDELLTSLGAEFYALADEYQVQFRMVSSRVAVSTDQRLLRRIVQNFLTNALRYGKGGKVLLGMRRVPGALRIEVWDTGPGIPEDKLQEIFQEFTRLEQQGAQEEKGLGLGLSIAQRMAKVLNHDIDVRSWPGKGTVFSVTVPRGVLQKTPLARARGAGVNNLQGVQVLCVDNEEPIRLGMKKLLEGWGCEVRTAASGSEAEVIITGGEFSPNVMLVDYHLDKGELGLDVLHKLQELSPETAGILVTANNSSELIEKVKADGFGYLRKMIKPAALRALISSMLQKAAA